MRPLLMMIVLLAPWSRASADDKSTPSRINFKRDVRPILARHCYGCHGARRQEGDYRLDRSAIALTGGDSGEKPILPGRSGRSPLVERIERRDPTTRMPPKGPGLTPAEIATLRLWIDQGARFPKDAQDGFRPSNHWAFQPRSDHPPPVVSGVRNPIDSFIVNRLADVNLAPSPLADRRTLVRRIYLDLLGLPPSPETIDAFVADTDPLAWERLVDRLLAHPHYGERWARHWLDVVRFAESHGFETNRERTGAWHFRDWCIQALNGDMPYDRFVTGQLAGDAIGEPAGTGFLVAGPYDLVKSSDITLTLAQRQDELADMVNTTGTAFLGLTVGCARCHNHKFDPVAQTDFYAMAAVFSGVRHADRPLPIGTPDSQLAELRKQLATIHQQLDPLVQQLRPAVSPRHNIERFRPVRARFIRFTIRNTNSSEPCLDELEVYTPGTDGRPPQNIALASAGTRATSSGNFPSHPFHKLAHINDGKHGNSFSWISSQKGRGWVQLELPRTVTIDRIEWGRDREGKYSDRTPTRYWIEVAEKEGEWREIAGIADRAPFGAISTNRPDRLFRDDLRRESALARGLFNQARTIKGKLSGLAQGPTAYIGRFDTPPVTRRLYRGDPQAPREPVAPGGLSAFRTPEMAMNEPEQARRLKLARWIATDDNPLASRVIANRVWQYHFGTGLVATPGDFGANGTPPSHPALLDWLAQDLVRHNWSLKALHRLILTSRTYRQSSRPRQEGLAVDASSRLLWRFPPRRLSAEAIRDGMLTASGALDRRMGGPGFKVFEIVLENVRHYFPRKHYTVNEWRRMVYMTKIRQEQDDVFGAFDCPDGNQVIASRSRSTTPLQALGLLNGNFVLQQARLLATRCDVDTAGRGPSAAVQRAFRLTLGRNPGRTELRAASALVTRHGLESLTRALLNSNEFLWLP